MTFNALSNRFREIIKTSLPIPKEKKLLKRVQQVQHFKKLSQRTRILVPDSAIKDLSWTQNDTLLSPQFRMWVSKNDDFNLCKQNGDGWAEYCISGIIYC